MTTTTTTTTTTTATEATGEDIPLHEMLQDRWAELVSLIFQEDKGKNKSDGLESTQKTLFPVDPDSDVVSLASTDVGSEESYDETVATDCKSVNKELSQLHFDLDWTERSLADLEQEFTEDLKALAFGLELAFDHFEEDNLQKQEARMSQSTRSTFKDTLESSLREKRTRRNTVCLPVDADDFADEQNKKEDSDFKNWFEKLWAIIEQFLALFADKKKKEDQPNPNSINKNLFELWFGLTTKQNSSDDGVNN